MPEPDDNSNFMKTVEEIQVAENQSELVVLNAKKKADDILRKAKENVLKERARTNDEIVALKNSLFQAGNEEIKNDVKKILKKAEVEAEKISRQKLSSKEVSALLKQFLASISG
jgi:vacuolar-type H+-ATPase subunit H